MDVGNPAAFPVTDEILVGEDGRGYFIAALGSVRASLCYPLRDAILFRLEERADVPAVYAELSRCLYMDSTFIGLLVAIDRKLQKGSGGRLHVVDPSPACLELFRQLGLQEIIIVETGGISMPPLHGLGGAGEKPRAEFILKAHEALMESSDEARRKFSLLRDVLESKLRGEKPRGDTR